MFCICKAFNEFGLKEFFLNPCVSDSLKVSSYPNYFNYLFVLQGACRGFIKEIFMSIFFKYYKVIFSLNTLEFFS